MKRVSKLLTALMLSLAATPLSLRSQAAPTSLSLEEAVRRYTAEPDTFEDILADDTFGHEQTLRTIRDGIFPALVRNEHTEHIRVLSPIEPMFCDQSPLFSSDKVIQMPEGGLYVARDTVENAVNAILRKKGIVY